MLEVEDCGRGVKAEDVSRVFDPFFTTKPPCSGTGLGLSVSHGIIESFHGRIECHSDGPGKGALFRVSLPLAN